MSWRTAAVTMALVAASTALAAERADVRAAMRAALLEHAPMPSAPATLPDRTAPAVPRTTLARRKPEADRAAREHARRDVRAAHAHEAHDATMRFTRGGSRSGADEHGCDEHMAADMMKSQGHMPGGGTTPGWHHDDHGGGSMPDARPSSDAAARPAGSATHSPIQR